MKTDLKRSEIVVCTVLVAALGILFFWISRSHFSIEEARLAKGGGVDFSEDWVIHEADGSFSKTRLPYRTDSLKTEHAALHHRLPIEYAGMALSLKASNALVNVYIDEELVYRSGTANDLDSLTEQQKDKYVPKDRSSAREADIGQLIVVIPRDIAVGSKIMITMDRDSKGSHMILSSAYIAERDDTVINIIQQSLIPLICGLLIVISAALLQSLDVIRFVNHRRRRGLVIIALFAVDALIYSFIRTDILYLFFGNRRFFLTLEELSYIIMPVFLTGFYFRGFKIHAPVKCRWLFYSSTVFALIDMMTYPFWGKYRFIIYYLNTLWRVAIILLLIDLLYRWRQARPESRKILLDVCALVSLMISVLANTDQVGGSLQNLLNMIQMVSITAYFIFMVGQHVQILLAEMQYQSKQRMEALKEQNLKMVIANQQAEEAKREAILAAEAKSRFLANMSHEIRTPINAVLGMDEMILRESRDPKILDYADDIMSAGRTLLSLINDILDFSKIETGNMEIVPVEYEVMRLITDLINMISRRAEAKGLDFEVIIDENIPSVLFGDDVRLRQCVMNLLTNAVKYTQEGQVTLMVSAEKAGEKAVLHFEVSDTGIGIKQEELPKLFMAYERIEESRNRNIEGTGLGMNITMQILDMMGSRLNVESVYGEGSIFSFDVEQKVVNNAPMGKIKPHQHHVSSEAAKSSVGFIAPDARILVVDDNAMNRKVFISLLSRIRLAIDEAEGGRESIELVKKNDYDLIFMDHMMPFMDGIEAMQVIRDMEDSPNATTKIYVLTANAVTGAKEMYLEAGFDGFLSKPIQSDQLEKVLRSELPEEKILPAEEEDEENNRSASPAVDLESYPVVDGLDWYFAYQHLPDENVLAETLRQFYELVPVQGNKLDGMYEKLDEEGMIDSYRIQVHGMKGLAMTVGIVPLAGMAKVLEYAARDGDRNVIERLHPVFIVEWRSYREKLVGVFDIGMKDDEDDRKEGTYRATLARLTMLKEAMEEFDIDRGDELMSQLREYRYPEAVEAIMDQLVGAVADIDSDLVTELADQIIGLGDWQK